MDLFVYATSDTMEVDKVSSNVKTKTDNDVIANSNTEENVDKTVIEETSAEDSTVSVEVADVLGYDISENDSYSLIYGEELKNCGIVLKSDKSEEQLAAYTDTIQPISDIKLNNKEVVDVSSTVVKSGIANTNEEVENKLIVNLVDNTATAVKEREDEEARQAEEARLSEIRRTGRASVTMTDQSDALLSIDNPDPNYTGAIVTLTPEDRDILERLVMGEAGAEGFEGAALVAQTIRDSIVYYGFPSANAVRVGNGYTGSIKKAPNATVKQAVAYVFDQGGVVVKHRCYYFYAFRTIKSRFHESQTFVIQYGGHRFFDRR